MLLLCVIAIFVFNIEAQNPDCESEIECLNDLYTLRKQCINEIIATFAGQKPPKMTVCDKRFVDLDLFGYKIKAQQAKYMRTCLLNSDYSFQSGQCPIFLWPQNLDLMSITATKPQDVSPLSDSTRNQACSQAQQVAKRCFSRMSDCPSGKHCEQCLEFSDLMRVSKEVEGAFGRLHIKCAQEMNILKP